MLTADYVAFATREPDGFDAYWSRRRAELGNLYDGWEHRGVPVLGETLLKAITVGSKVEYVDPARGGVMHTRHLLRAEDLDTETIVQAVRSPVELAIAPERGAVAHLEEQVAGILFRVPEFTVPEGPAPTDPPGLG